MNKTQKNKQIETLTNLLIRINKGEDPQKLRQEASQIIADLVPRDITSAEHRLLDYGFSLNLAHQLSATFLLMGLFESRKGDLRKHVSPDHILYQVSIEHDWMRCYAANLQSCTAALNDLEQPNSLSSEYRRLIHITQHLNASREHFERERDVIFPMLQHRGLTRLCREVTSLHKDVEMAIHSVYNVAMNIKSMKPEDFKTQLSDVSNYLISVTLQSLNIEDRSLYTTALEQIDDAAFWQRMKWVCDDIGYCTMHAS